MVAENEEWLAISAEYETLEGEEGASVKDRDGDERK